MPIFLVRHGETDANAARVVQRPEAPLSARGRAQAARLANRLRNEGIVLVLASDLARARETAAAVVERTGARLVVDAGLAERNYGDVRGTPYAALAEDIFAPTYEPPGGETWAAFHARVDAAWARVLAAAATAGGPIAVVTHGLVCDRVVARHCDVAAGAAPRAWGNTAVTLLDGAAARQVRLLACTAHLDDAPTTGGPA